MTIASLVLVVLQSCEVHLLYFCSGSRSELSLCRCLRSSFKWTLYVVDLTPDCFQLDHTHYHHMTTFQWRRTSALIPTLLAAFEACRRLTPQSSTSCIMRPSYLLTCMLSAAAWSSRVQVQVQVQVQVKVQANIFMPAFSIRYSVVILRRRGE